MNSQVLIGCLLLLGSAAVRAETLHRCVDPRGAVSYQSAACPPGSRSDRSIAYVPDPPPIAAASSVRAATRAPRRDGWSASKVSRPGPALDPCRQARVWRETELERLGLKRRFDDLSRIDARVRSACKGY